MAAASVALGWEQAPQANSGTAARRMRVCMAS
jgi:hypothetical protein